MGLCSDHWSLWWCKALSRSRSFATTLNNYLLTIFVVLTTINYTNANSLPGKIHHQIFTHQRKHFQRFILQFSFSNYLINHELTHTNHPIDLRKLISTRIETSLSRNANILPNLNCNQTKANGAE